MSQDVAALAGGSHRRLAAPPTRREADRAAWVTRVDGQGFVLDTDAGCGDSMVARLKKFLLRTKAEIERLPWRCLALRGTRSVRPRPGCSPCWRGRRDGAPVRVERLERDRPARSERCDPRPGHRTAARGDHPLCARGRRGVPHRLGHPRQWAANSPRRRSRPKRTRGPFGELHQGVLHGQELVARLDARGNNVPAPVWSVLSAAPIRTPTAGTGWRSA